MLEHPKSTSARKAVQVIGEAAAGGAQSIDRAATLLLLVGRAGPSGARLSELVEQCDLAKPTVRRMLLALVRAGLLDQDPETRRYHLGPEIYVLGTLASTRFGIHPISLRALERLSQETGDTAFLSVPRDVYSICVHREEGAYPIRIHALHAGDRHPLGVGAGSLALLSALPDSEVEQVLAANADVLAEKYPQHSPSVLRMLVQEARAKGYAMNPGMLLPGSWGIGVPIRGLDGRSVRSPLRRLKAGWAKSASASWPHSSQRRPSGSRRACGKPLAMKGSREPGPEGLGFDNAGRIAVVSRATLEVRMS